MRRKMDKMCSTPLMAKPRLTICKPSRTSSLLASQWLSTLDAPTSGMSHIETGNLVISGVVQVGNPVYGGVRVGELGASQPVLTGEGYC